MNETDWEFGSNSTAELNGTSDLDYEITGLWSATSEFSEDGSEPEWSVSDLFGSEMALDEDVPQTDNFSQPEGFTPDEDGDENLSASDQYSQPGHEDFLSTEIFSPSDDWFLASANDLLNDSAEPFSVSTDKFFPSANEFSPSDDQFSPSLGTNPELSASTPDMISGSPNDLEEDPPGLTREMLIGFLIGGCLLFIFILVMITLIVRWKRTRKVEDQYQARPKSEKGRRKKRLREQAEDSQESDYDVTSEDGSETERKKDQRRIKIHKQREKRREEKEEKIRQEEAKEREEEKKERDADAKERKRVMKAREQAVRERIAREREIQMKIAAEANMRATYDPARAAGNFSFATSQKPVPFGKGKKVTIGKRPTSETDEEDDANEKRARSTIDTAPVPIGDLLEDDDKGKAPKTKPSSRAAKKPSKPWHPAAHSTNDGLPTGPASLVPSVLKPGKPTSPPVNAPRRKTDADPSRDKDKFKALFGDSGKTSPVAEASRKDSPVKPFVPIVRFEPEVAPPPPMPSRSPEKKSPEKKSPEKKPPEKVMIVVKMDVSSDESDDTKGGWDLSD
jgi:hypothetical protein